MERVSVTLEELRASIGSGAVDTVLVVFPDLQGRLVGKRVTGGFFLERVAEGSIEACNYLLAVDVEMTPLPGYRAFNWDQGYGDFSAVPDLTTIRMVPWLEKTALVLCDLVDEHSRQPIEVSPRRILQRLEEQAAARGLLVHIGAELEFFLFKESYADAAAKRYQDLTPHSDVIEDYHILQTSRDEYLIRAIRNGLDAAGVPVEFSKGEAGKGQHEINLAYATATEMADRNTIYKNAAKEIADQHGRSLTFMAKYAMDEVGSSCHIHSSVWDREGARSLMWDEAAPHHLSDTFRHWLGGLVHASRELSLLFAPTVNSYKRFQPDSWAPTAVAWGLDNRTCGLRLVGHGQGYRVESRIPGADVNSYLAFAGVIAAGLWGIEHQLDPGEPFVGNAYTDPDVAHIPSTLVESIDLFRGSEVARWAFGDEVHHHILNTAEQEWASFNRAVTDWELRRNFEQF
ncbi:MAG: glutamine synthetase [Acidimicrobiales bacterium]|jgi:glutamine synthetase|nr:glutamine synthetase [Acidimicrobiales bacterium]